MLEEPHYTRPAELRGWEVPGVLRSGDHGLLLFERRLIASDESLGRPEIGLCGFQIGRAHV